MTFSHCGKFGDMLMCLPILSAHYKRTGEKPSLVLAQFPYADSAIELLKLQECIGDMVIIILFSAYAFIFIISWRGFPASILDNVKPKG